MTAAERGWTPWAVHPTVELAPGASARIEEVDHAPGVLSVAAVNELFVLGLHAPQDDAPPRTGRSFSQIVLAGEAEFRIGEVDLGRERGLEIVNRGFACALEAGRMALIEQWANPQQPESSGALRPEDDEPRGDLETVLDVNEAAERWDELIEAVAADRRRVVLLVGREPSAVLLAWSSYTLLREQQAQVAAAYWAHWHTGEFNAVGYAADVLRVLRPSGVSMPTSTDRPLRGHRWRPHAPGGRRPGRPLMADVLSAHLRPRVELLGNAVIRLAETGRPPDEPFSSTLIARAFATGLLQPPRTSARDPDAPTAIALVGDARFLVGQVDLGAEHGMEILARGVEAAVDAVLEQDRKRAASTTAGGGTHATELGTEGADVREIPVPVPQAGGRLRQLVGMTGHGARVALLDGDVRVAVLMAWSSYETLRALGGCRRP